MWLQDTPLSLLMTWFLLLLHIKGVGNTVSLTSHPPIPLWDRSKTSSQIWFCCISTSTLISLQYLASVVVGTAVVPPPSSRQQRFLFLLNLKRVENTVSPTSHPPISLRDRTKTSSVVFQQNLQGVFSSSPTLCASLLASWFKALLVIDRAKQRKFKQAETPKSSSWSDAR